MNKNTQNIKGLEKTTEILDGLAISPGIAVAKAYIINDVELEIDQGNIKIDQIPEEISRLNNAMEKTKEQLQAVYETAKKNIGEENAEIIQTHIAMADDPTLIDGIREKIETNHDNSALAVQKTIAEQITMFDNIEDLYIKERIVDVKDLGERIIRNILGMPFKDISCLPEDVIIIAKELTPSLIAIADISHIKGIISEMGGMTSHTAILARSMEIPAVFGTKGATCILPEGAYLAIDGGTGEIQFNLSQTQIMDLRDKIRNRESTKKMLSQLIVERPTTLDHHEVKLCSNVGSMADVEKALKNGSDGIGLLRTEFMFMEKKAMPTEEEQYLAYKQIVEGFRGKPVIIRTFDVGGDKEISYFNIPKEQNPFMGFRAIRVCLDNPEMFKTQLRAILRTSINGNVKIMYPMISSVEEVIHANRLLEVAKQELRDKSVPFDSKIEVGVMIEIPSAAIAADIIIKQVDFFSIGTNDLTQYTLAVDRTNENVSYLYNSFNPAVLRLIKNVIDASHKEGKTTGICGELAGNPLATLLLLGMGLDEFSMSSSLLLKVKKIISSVKFEEAKRVSETVLRMNNVIRIEEYLIELLKEKELSYLLKL